MIAIARCLILVTTLLLEAGANAQQLGVAAETNARQLALRQAQIEAIGTGNFVALDAISDSNPAIMLAKVWTRQAAQRLQQSHPNISRESALLTSDFILRGAEQFVADGSSIHKRIDAEDNLNKFVDELLRIGNKEGGRIGETTFSAATRSLCPLWPFC